MELNDPVLSAEDALRAVVEGTGSMEDARAAVADAVASMPGGIYRVPEDPVEKLLDDSVKIFKMALDSLEGDQVELAKGYLRVARIKLRQVEEGRVDEQQVRAWEQVRTEPPAGHVHDHEGHAHHDHAGEPPPENAPGA